MRAHYPLSTIKEVAARLCKAKVSLFSVLDVKNKFPERKEDEASTVLQQRNKRAT